MDAWKHGRRFERGLDDALVHFKGMVELAVIDRDC
jgi:hypothetical protein